MTIIATFLAFASCAMVTVCLSVAAVASIIFTLQNVDGVITKPVLHVHGKGAVGKLLL